MEGFFDGFYIELHELLEDDFTGKVTLHCLRGKVQKYDIQQTKTPKNGSTDITESGSVA